MPKGHSDNMPRQYMHHIEASGTALVRDDMTAPACGCAQYQPLLANLQTRMVAGTLALLPHGEWGPLQ